MKAHPQAPSPGTGPAMTVADILAPLPESIHGANPLLSAAQPLLESLMLLKNREEVCDLQSLRDQLIAMVRAFVESASQAGINDESLSMARYCLCTTVDEVIAGTPWGGGVWGSHSLLVTFHHEASGGERFFRILQWLSQTPAENLDMLEFLHALLAMGLEGRYRIIEGGAGALERLRERLYLLIREKRGPVDPSLSAGWTTAAAHLPRCRGRIVQLYGAVTLCVVLLIMYLTLDHRLGLTVSPVLQAYEHLATQEIRPRVATPPPRQNQDYPSRLAAILAPEIERQQISLENRPGAAVIILHADDQFDSGQARLRPGHEALLHKIGQALADAPGKIVVTGHTDNRPTARGAPDNWQLSRARAEAVVALLKQASADARRYEIRALADTAPLAANDTPAHRARNRRVEIAVLDGARQ